MSKFNEVFNILFGKKIIVVGNTSFEVKNEVLNISDNENRWLFSPSSLGLVYLSELKDGSDASYLNIGFTENNSYSIQIKDSYASNKRKLNYLMDLKANASKGKVIPKIGAFSLMAILNTVLVFFVALTIFNSATSLVLQTTTNGVLSNRNNMIHNSAEAIQPSPDLSASNTGLSPEQQLQARNSQLIKPNRELASLLQKGAGVGDYSFTLGPLKSSNKGTLYVFSDPLCPRCQDLEPLLEELSADYRIEIFPVSVIGTETTIEASSRLVKTVLCEAPDSRGTAWQKIMRDPNTPTADCEAGPIALKNNIDTFHAFNFIGTPAIVRADGASFDLTKRKNVESVIRWLGEAAQ